MLLYFAATLCLVAVTKGDEVTSPEPPTANEEFTDAYYPYPGWSDAFDWKLLKAFSGPEHKNVLISPISLRLILALLYESASSSTEIELQEVLNFPTNKTVARQNIRDTLDALKAAERKEYVLNIGTRMFLDEEIKPQPIFASKAQEFFQTDVAPTNFSNPPEASTTINSWVNTLTNGRIPELVKPDELQNAIMVIGNAIYFKGSWLHHFLKNKTHNGGFYLTPTQTIDIQYMAADDYFFYHESVDLNAKILRLPYRGGRYAFFMILPNSIGGLEELIRTVNLDTLRRQLYFMDFVRVHVNIPKFKFDFQTRYTEILKGFGLRQMFENTASFPGIVTGKKHLLRRLQVSDIIQKSGIEIDEEGSVVYSATDVQLGNKFGEAENYFNATHPFLFFIEEQTRGTVLFIGKVTNPLDSETVPLPTRLGELDPEVDTPIQAETESKKDETTTISDV